MKLNCEFCGALMNDYDLKCPNCGAGNAHVKTPDNVPHTIEELKKWYVDMKLPSENITRFFIGKNYKEPRAFGIYKDLSKGSFIVYKNKNDGTRVIHYDGGDENYAVNEVYLKLKEKIAIYMRK